MGTHKDSVVLVWQSGLPDGVCSQLFQSSRNGGVTWSRPQTMLEGLSECPLSNEFVEGLSNNLSPRDPPRLYLLTETQNQVFLSAWNGLQWSEPQEQSTLSGFEDPELYTQVALGCQQSSLLGAQLYIVGCDQSGGGDVWVTSRELRTTASWFSSPAWTPPAPVTDEQLEVEAVELSATRDNLIHAFISQRQSAVISYTHWDGGLWSNISPVLKLPDGSVGGFEIVEGPENELFLFVSNNQGGLYVARAPSDAAATASNWSTPTRLQIAHDGEAGSFDVARDDAGTLYMAYSVPVNERRGVYLVHSKDSGATWSKPVQVFDGTTAGFDLVGAPSLLRLANGSLHVTWKEQSIQGDGAPQSLSLYYARSEDGGLN